MKDVIGLISANFTTEDMQGLSDERSIASMPFAGRYRLVDFALSNMINAGITAVGLVTPYKFRSLMDHIGTGSAWMLDRKKGGLYILPGSTYGMSSRSDRFLLCDIRQNDIFLRRSTSDYVLLTASNIIWNIDFRPFIRAHMESGADITMLTQRGVRKNPHGRKVHKEGEKVLGISTGVDMEDDVFLDTFLISRELLLQFLDWYSARDYLDIFDILKDDYEKMDIRTWYYDGYARMVFSIDNYFNANMDLLDMDINGAIFDEHNPIRTKVQDCIPARMYPESSVRNSLISSGCAIWGEVDGSVLFRGVTVEEGAIVRNSVIMQSCIIKSGAIVKDAVIDRNNLIGKGMIIKGSSNDIYVMRKEQRIARRAGS